MCRARHTKVLTLRGAKTSVKMVAMVSLCSVDPRFSVVWFHLAVSLGNEKIETMRLHTLPLALWRPSLQLSGADTGH